MRGVREGPCAHAAGSRWMTPATLVVGHTAGVSQSAFRSCLWRSGSIDRTAEAGHSVTARYARGMVRHVENRPTARPLGDPLDDRYGSVPRGPHRHLARDRAQARACDHGQTHHHGTEAGAGASAPPRPIPPPRSRSRSAPHRPGTGACNRTGHPHSSWWRPRASSGSGSITYRPRLWTTRSSSWRSPPRPRGSLRMVASTLLPDCGVRALAIGK